MLNAMYLRLSMIGLCACHSFIQREHSLTCYIIKYLPETKPYEKIKKLVPTRIETESSLYV